MSRLLYRHLTRHTRIFLIALVSLAGVIVAPLANAQATSYPETLVSVGDSISARPLSSLSWSTGTSEKVQSIHTRLEAATGSKVTAIRKAVRGADSSALTTQMQAAIKADANLVTVLMGGNDVCGPTLDSMTAPETFRERYEAALDMAESAGVNVAAVSIPNIYGLWEVGKESTRARAIWDAYNICQNALANPLSTDQADVERRLAIQRQTEMYNAIIASECTAHTNCAYDDGAVYALTPTLEDLTFDYFHPNTAGQAKIAAAVWPAVQELYPGLPDVASPSAPPTQPETTDTAGSKSVTVNTPIKVNIGVSKVAFSVDGTTFTGNVEYLGAGAYKVTVNDTGDIISKKVSKVHITAYGDEGAVIYQGTVSMRSVN